MKIIGIMGDAGSGKDTCADIIQRLMHDHNTTAARYSFACPIKRVAKEQFEWNGKKDEAGRQLLIDLGMIGRAYKRDLWLDKAVEYFRIWDAPYGVVPDVRFANEYDYITQNQGLIFRVVRPCVEPMDDESERSLDGFLSHDVWVNRGSLEELQQQVYSSMKQFGVI